MSMKNRTKSPGTGGLCSALHESWVPWLFPSKGKCSRQRSGRLFLQKERQSGAASSEPKLFGQMLLINEGSQSPRRGPVGSSRLSRGVGGSVPVPVPLGTSRGHTQVPGRVRRGLAVSQHLPELLGGPRVWVCFQQGVNNRKTKLQISAQAAHD